MTITRTTAYHFELSYTEKYILERAMETLKEIQDKIPENKELASNTTGECFNERELSRARGVVDGILNISDWVLLDE